MQSSAAVPFYDTTLAYSEIGDKSAPILCLVHGYCDRASLWKPLAEALAESYRVILPDLPGFGASGLPAAWLGQDHALPVIEDYSDALKVVIDHVLEKTALEKTALEKTVPGKPAPDTIAAGRITLIGHSMGGYTALAFAERHPELLRGLGLFHSHAFADEPEKKETRRKTVAYIRRYGARQFIGDFARNLFAAENRETMTDVMIRHVQRIADTREDALAAGMQAMITRPDRTHVLAQAPWPVLFVLGAQDEAIPLQLGLRQVVYPALSQVEIFRDSGHMGMLECPDRSLELLRSYLAGR